MVLQCSRYEDCQATRTASYEQHVYEKQYANGETFTYETEITNSYTTCANDATIGSTWNAADDEACQAICSEVPGCAYCGQNSNSKCSLFENCDATRTAEYKFETYKKVGAPTPSSIAFDDGAWFRWDDPPADVATAGWLDSVNGWAAVSQGSSDPTYDATGGYVVFDGSARLAVASVDASHLPSANISVEATVRVDATQDWGAAVSFFQDNGDNKRGWVLGWIDAKFMFSVVTDEDEVLNYATSEASAYSTGEWYTLVGTYDGEYERLYVNGELAVETEKTGAISYAADATLTLGAYYDSDEDFGLIGALAAASIGEAPAGARAAPTVSIAPTVSMAPTPLPTPTPSTAAVSSLASSVRVGEAATYVLNEYGGVWAVGYPNYGQLGDNTNSGTGIVVPQRVDDIVKNVVQIEAGKGTNAYGTPVVAVTDDGSLYFWPQIAMQGSGVGEGNSYTLELSGFSGPVVDAAVSAGINQYHHVCAVVSHGDSNAVECLGYNNYGQLGDGTKANQDTPQPVNGLPPSFDAIQVAASYSSACASNETHAWCWGYNQYGQLGDGTTTSQDSGANDPVIGSGTFDAPIADLQCGGHHCCMLLASGNMSCWGYNNYGQLGDGMTTNQNKPVVVAGLDGAIALMSVGYQSSCAVTFDNELYCWVRRSALDARVTSEFDPRHPVDACACPSRPSLRSRVCVASLRSWFVSDSLSVSCLLLRATHTGIQRTVPAGRRDEDESVQTNTSHHCAWPVRNHEHLRRVLSQLRHRGRRCRHVLGSQQVSRTHGSLTRLHSMASFIFPPSPVCWILDAQLWSIRRWYNYGELRRSGAHGRLRGFVASIAGANPASHAHPVDSRGVVAR